jgi:mono/diheme cytochrome c family protein
MQNDRKDHAAGNIVLLGVFVGMWMAAVSAVSQEPSSINATPTNQAAAAPSVTNASAKTPSNNGEAPQRDLIAARYLTTCASCHSLTGAKLSGPELTPATKWPDEQLKLGIKKMESKVGPLPDELVADLAVFLKAPDVRERLKAEGERMAAMFTAKMEPADSAVGQQLFTGARGLKNGGLACAACHKVEGRGGNLGLPLDGVFAKVGGELPLTSAIENSNFKIMLGHYKRYPVTKQEARHLAKYLGTLEPGRAPAKPMPIATAGAGFALAALVGLIGFLRTQRSQRRSSAGLRRRN